MEPPRQVTHRPWLALILAGALCPPIAALDPAKSVSQYIHKKWTVEDGLPQQVTGLAQTPDGYIWIGTVEGLFRFDGLSFSRLDAPQAPKPGYTISSIIAAADGTLWFNVGGKGIYRLQKGNISSFSSESDLGSGPFRSLGIDAEGSYWVGSSAGLNRLHNGKVTVYTKRDGLPNNIVSRIYIDRRNEIWIGTFGGLAHWQNGGFRAFTSREGLLSNRITALHRDRQGVLWIGTDKGLQKLQEGRIISLPNQLRLTSSYVTSILEDKDGNLWIGSRGGLNRIYRGKIEPFTDDDGLSNNYVRVLFQDGEDTLWIGTAGGLDQLRDGKLTPFGTKERLSSDYITCISEDREGALWVGNGENGVNVLKEGSVFGFSVADGLTHDNVSTICCDRQGGVWVGTWGGGINLLKEGKISHLTTRHGLCSDLINAIYQDREGALWIGTEGQGLDRLQNGKIRHFSMQNGLAGNFISTILQDRKGNIWITTEDGGLSLYRDGAITNYTTDHGLSEDFLTAIHEDEEGNLWIASQNSGINLFRAGKFTVISKRAGLYSDTILHILEDQRKNLWMSTPQGIFSVNRKDLLLLADGKLATINCTVYGKSDGMRNIQCVGHSQTAGWKSRDGRLWFPTMEGVVMVDPTHIQINWKPPEVRIERFLVDGKSQPVDRKAVLPPGRRSFEFHYTALLLAAPEKVLFKYRLEGFDKDWIDAQNRRAAYYTAIKPGNYRFRVSACNNDGIWNEAGAVLPFTIKPQFYQSAWFVPLCILLAMVFAFSIYRMRIAGLKQKQRQLSRLVHERTRELSSEKEKLEKANVTKSEFLSFAAHDLKNPLQAIMGTAQLIGSQADSGSRLEQRSRKIMFAAERMLNLIDELLQSSMIESGQTQMNRACLDVSQLADRIILSCQPLAAKKDQKLIISAVPGLLVDGDEQLIQQSFENLVSNAIKFSPAGKSIWVTLVDVGPMVHFSVRDEGPGLTRQDKELIFGRFRRLSAQPTGGESSTGLGLFIVKQLIELHGGRIFVESEQGRGSTFVIELPRLDKT